MLAVVEKSKQEASPEARAYIAKLVKEMYERIERGEEEEVTVTLFKGNPVSQREEDFSSFSL